MKNKGFTLIELIIVIAIIGVLAAAIILIIDPAKQLQKARDGQRKADVRQIQSALEIYRSDIGNYPTLDDLLNCPESDPDHFGSPATSENPACASTYLKTVPTDPRNVEPYFYTYEYIDGGKAYNLIACLENMNDTQKDPSNNSLCDGTTNWSYTVSNP